MKLKSRIVVTLLMGGQLGMSSVLAAVPSLENPANAGTVYQTVPYLKWADAVPHPYRGSYQIQIDDQSDFSSPWDDDTIPAILRWYSPTAEMTRGQTYYWRVRHIAEDGIPDVWSATNSFTVGVPRYFDVLETDTYADIQSEFQQAAAYGNANAQAGCLRFPAGVTMNLSVPATLAPLFDSNGNDNWIIEGQNSKLVFELPQPSWGLKAHITELDGSDHIQISNIQIDYAANSINHIAGQITAIDHAAGTFTISVDRSTFAINGFDAEVVGIFWNTGRTRALTQSATMQNSWGAARINDSTYSFTVGNDKMTTEQWEFLQVGDWFVTNEREGDLLDTRGVVTDMVAYNITSWHNRGRFHVGYGLEAHKRFINCRVTRPDGSLRVYACHSHSNTQGSFLWWENMMLEYCRDDTLNCGQDEGNAGGVAYDGEYVVRNCYLTGGARGGITGCPDRSWIAGNTIKDMEGISTWSDSGRYMDTGVIEDNLLLATLPYPVTYERTPEIIVSPDTKTGGTSDPLSSHQYLMIRNNVSRGVGGAMIPFAFHEMAHSAVSNNLMIGDTDLPAASPAFSFDACDAVIGTNYVDDYRIPAASLLQETGSSDMSVVVSAVGGDRPSSSYQTLLTETWDSASPTNLTGTGTLTADKTWSYDAADWSNWGVHAAGAPLLSNAFGMADNGASTSNPEITATLSESILPESGNTVSLSAKAVFNKLTTAGGSNSRLTVMNSTGSEFYQIWFHAQTDANTPIELYVNDTGFAVGGIGDQVTNAVYDISVDFNRISGTQTEVVYDILVGGSPWQSGTQTVANAVSAGTALDKVQLLHRLRCPSFWDDIEVGAVVAQSISNSAPAFMVDPIVETAAVQDTPYNSTLADDAADAESASLTFSKLLGPSWLNVASNGMLSGMPSFADVGSNHWTVSVSDGVNPAELATLEMMVSEAYTLTYSAGSGGSISGVSTQTVGLGASGTAVTAMADSAFRFVDWSDGRTDNPRTDTNVTADVSVTANFAALGSQVLFNPTIAVSGISAGDLDAATTSDGGASGAIWSVGDAVIDSGVQGTLPQNAFRADVGSTDAGWVVAGENSAQTPDYYLNLGSSDFDFSGDAVTITMNLGLSRGGYGRKVDIRGYGPDDSNLVFQISLDAGGDTLTFLTGTGEEDQGNPKALGFEEMTGEYVTYDEDLLGAISVTLDGTSLTYRFQGAGMAAPSNLVTAVLNGQTALSRIGFEGDGANGGGWWLDDLSISSGTAVQSTGYEVWSNSYALIYGPEGHDDSDGLNNLGEYALGGDPKDAGNKGYPVAGNVTNADGTIWYCMTYPRRSDPNSGISYIVEKTESLVGGSWTTTGVEYVETEVDGFTNGLDAVTVRVATDATNRFIRVRVEMP